MKKLLGLTATSFVLFFVALGGVANADLIYSTIPTVLPGNVDSLGYQATQTASFGDLIQFAGGATTLSGATAVMSDWALESTYETVGTSAGYYVPLTLTLYNVGAGNTVGSVIASDTETDLVPWRPEADPTCPGGGTAWRDGGGNCWNGLAFTVGFNFSGVSVPAQIIYGLSFNTQSSGANPIGVAGPYNSLNFGLSTDPPSVGSNPLPDTAYWNTTTASNYTDGGAGGTGTFRQDTGWSPYSGMVEFTDTPEPGTLSLIGIGLVGLVRRFKR